MRIEYHRTLIADTHRNARFHAALNALIVPGETVVADIGAGTGLIGMMAAALGARRVIMYESEAVAEVARHVVKASRQKGIELMPCHSTEMREPPRADLVVSETLGNYALEENIIATLTDARKRHLKPGGRLIPSAIRQKVAAVTSPRIHRELTVWDETGRRYGFDLGPAMTMSLNNIYVRKLEVAELLDDGRSAVLWDEVALGLDGRSTRKGEGRWRLARPATIHGFALWWEAELAPGITLATGPADPPTHWEQLYLPLLSPIPVAAGEEVVVRIRSRSSYEGGTHIAWSASHKAASGREKARQDLDLDKGFLP
jgi:protein arginine N-methyltransferase 1